MHFAVGRLTGLAKERMKASLSFRRKAGELSGRIGWGPPEEDMGSESIHLSGVVGSVSHYLT